MMQIVKKFSLFLLVAGYALAGANHFRNPSSYYRIIPAYIRFPHTANIMAGLCEILFALMLIPANTRRWAAWGIILLLIAFLPVHISMIADAPLKLGDILVTPLLAWLRLFLQPVLILWAWWHSRDGDIRC